MELKVWVDGVVRVVCGLSQETSCQDVVIALAQAIGQTGRYILIQKLRDTERQLLADERPLESLAKLGQHGSEVQFYLRRTGPSSSERPAPDRTSALPKHSDVETTRQRDPKKSYTFNLGPSSSPKIKHQAKKTPRASPDMRATPSPPATTPSSGGTSKEEVFRLILQQQARLQSLEAQLEMVEGEAQTWERPPGPELQEELERLAQVAQWNHVELSREATWEGELRVEAEKERDLRRHRADLHASLEDYDRQLHEYIARAAQLEHEVQQETRRGESLSVMRAELQSQEKKGAELESSLTETEEDLRTAEALLQVKNEELDELNKELRQCNLQQFIQQTGVPPASSPPHLEVPEPPEQPTGAKLQPGGHSNGESPPRPTAKHFLGNPRNLQNPLVSSLNPEVLTSRESSWR